MSQNNRLQLYGAGWCLKSSNLSNYLQSIFVDFDFHNVETDPEAEAAVRQLYDGALKFPTVVYGDHFLKNPKIPELRRFLEEHQLLS